MAIESTHERLLTVVEVAERLHVHPITVRRLIKAGKLAAVRVGRAVRVRESEVEGAMKPQPGPNPEELERRRKVVEEMRRRRARMQPLGFSTLELIKEGRRELEERTERHLGLRR
jgi:excisionase family DNA binding protein